MGRLTDRARNVWQGSLMATTPVVGAPPRMTPSTAAAPSLRGEKSQDKSAEAGAVDPTDKAFLREIIARRKAVLLEEHNKWLSDDPSAISDAEFSASLAAVFVLEGRLTQISAS